MAQAHFIAWGPVFIAAIAAWIFGAVYYGLLGNVWLAAQGKTKEMMQAENAGKPGLAKAAPFVISFLAELVMAAGLFGIMFHIGIFTIRAGIFSGALCWVTFVLTTTVVMNAYTFRRPKLTLIDTGHWLGVLMIIGAILGAMGPG